MLAVPAFAGLFVLLLRAGGAAAAGWLGWAGGAGHFAAALFWIIEPFLVAPEVHGWMAPFALVLMALGMALFWVLAGALALFLAGRRGVAATLVALVAGFAATDLIRGYVFTGFPWALLGHIWIGTPAMQAAAWVGPIGLSVLTGAAAAGLAAGWAAFFPRRAGPAGSRLMRAAPPVVAAAALVAVVWAGGVMRLAAPEPPATDVRLRIIQPNAPQHLKWRPDLAMMFFERHLALTSQPSGAGVPPPDLVIWPETAVPFHLNDPGIGIEMIAGAAGGAPVAFGIQRGEGGRWFNSLAVIDGAGAPVALYDKVHLVPFGEYIPFGDTLARFGITAFAAQEGNGFSPGPAGFGVMDLGPLGRVLPLICYEAVFPQDLRAAERAGGRADWILQATNDAWFGALSGPYQHLAQAQLRAAETGLPLMRSANTGVSAAIDAKGRILAEVALDREGVIDVALPASLPPTLYARTGDGPAAVLLALVLSALGWAGRRRGGERRDGAHGGGLPKRD